jgi:hypothetical protein
MKELQPLAWELADYGTESRSRALSYLRSYHYLVSGGKRIKRHLTGVFGRFL